MAEASWSLQRRLRRQLLIGITGLWLVGALISLAGLWFETTEVLDSALEETAQALLSLPDAALDDQALSPPGFGAHEEHIVFQVFDDQGRMRTRSHAAPAHPLDADPSSGLRRVGDWHVLTMLRPDGRLRVQVADTTNHRIEVLGASALGLAMALAVVLPLSAWGIRVLLERGFAALEPARQDLALRPSHDLRPLASGELPSELQPWVHEVNELMVRVRAMVEAERAFSAHMAHELRTPLAAARAQAQRLAQMPVGTGHAEHATALVRQLDRLTALATRLLQLARIDAGVALERDTVDLRELARLVTDEFGEACRQGQLRLDAQVPPCLVQGDIDALGIALRNLIDNALKHGGPGASVTVAVRPGLVSVTDDGPGVRADQLEQLGQRFQRGKTPIGGAGLGLAMARTIAQQSGARLRLESPVAQGHGFAAHIEFDHPMHTA